MKRVIVYCEGPTEETFVKQLLAPMFFSRNIFLSASSCDGVSKYSIIKKDLTTLCKSDPSAIVTTMLDYYALPSSTPGMASDAGCDIYEKVSRIEEEIQADIAVPNLIPNLVLHEFEALLFSQPECFRYCGMSDADVRKLTQMRTDSLSPEHINNNPNTAPSKRILSVYPSYSKILDGYNIAKDIGIDVIRRECRHFNDWMNQLEALEEDDEQGNL